MHSKTLLASLAVLSIITCALAQDAPSDTAAPPAQVDTNAGRWPMQIPSPAGQVTLFQPQLEDFQGDTLSARAAISITPPNANPQTAPIVGAVWMKSRVATDRVARTVHILDVDITRTRIPGLDDASNTNLIATLKTALNTNQPTLSLDQLLEMVQTVQKEQQANSDLQNNPPKIVFRDHPTVKVQYDGQPKLIAVDKSPLLRVANTPFFVVLDPQTKTYYLKGAGLWFTAPDPLGPFQSASQVPAPISALADASDYKDPQTPIAPAQVQRVEIITAADPTELVWTDGQPQFGTIANTGLLYVTNTDADLFMLIDNQQLYLLLSGRWYNAPNRNGPWTYVPSNKLPPDFARIPPASDKGDVLAHVAGTQAANDAIADAAVPQTATVQRKNFDQPPVEYDGPPQFQPAQGSAVSYAVNTSDAIFLVNGMYYDCYNGVWYQSPAPTGPWDLCLAVPPAIYQIPPSCPLYSCRYAYVYGSTPDYVYCGYLPGYVGCYDYDGCVVYGTGFYYQPWWGHHYYPRPWTYGFAAHYNTYVGHWGFNFGIATGGGAIWIGQGNRAWGRDQPWFGYGGYRPVVLHNQVNADLFRNEYFNRVRPGAANQARPDTFNRNLYANRSDVHVEWANQTLERPVENRPNENHPTEVRPNAPAHPEVAPHADQHLPEVASPQNSNDLFLDRAGNVYRKTDTGWEINDKNQWRQTPQAAPAEHQNAAIVEHPIGENADVNHAQHVEAPVQREAPEVNRDYNARVAGEQRFQNYTRSAPAEAPHASAPAESSHAGPSAGPGGGGNTGGRR